MRKNCLALLLAFVMLLACTGCGGSKTDTPDSNGGDGAAAAKDVLTIAYESDCGDYNPHGLTSMGYWIIKSQSYEPLFTLDFYTGELKNLLATGYEWIDNSTLKIELRKGVQFHNGYGEMTAEDVLFSLTEVYNSGANYPVATLDIPNCEIVDDYTVILRTTEPYSPLVNNLSNGACSIFSKAGFEADGGKFAVDIGTGPFVLDEWLEGESVTQVRFDDYWDGAPALSKVVWKVIDSATSRALELQTGGCDLAYEVSLLDKDALTNAGCDFMEFYSNDESTVFFNCDLPMFRDNVALRKAFAYALDREKFAQVARNNADYATPLLLDPNHPYAFKSIEEVEAAGGTVITFDLDKAKELFTEAGYFDPSSPIYNYTFTLTATSGASWGDYSAAYKSDLESIGVHMDIVTYDFATYVNKLKVAREFELGSWGTAPVTGDWEYFALHYFGESTASINLPQCKNDDFDALVREYRATTDPAEQKEIAQKAMLILYDNYYQIPTYTTVETWCAAEGVQDFTMGEFMAPLLKNVSFQ